MLHSSHCEFRWLIAGYFVLINIVSCGFAYEKRITGRYYIVGVDSKEELSLNYKLGGGSYIGKAPGQLREYGFNDTFLVAKTEDYDSGDEVYYVIDMRKDSEYAHEEVFRVGPISEDDFFSN